jgi:phosphoribosylformimino-5-aminoimidazole carboxamide ribotide isomerase
VGLIRRIVQAIPIPVELGGGLRTDADLRAALDAGVSRVILGTRAALEPATLAGLVAEFGDALAVGIDARNGRVQVRGWVETTAQTAAELAAAVGEAGVATLIYTDTARDGMLRGPNLEAMQQVCTAAGCDVIASGGITCARDIGALVGLACPNLAGAVVGKALYEQAVSLGELQVAARGSTEAP